MTEKDNHGKVGEVLHIKMTLEKLNSLIERNIDIPDKTKLSIEELNKLNVSAGVPLIIDENTKGNYEAVCEYGTEVHYND